nr:MAG: zinc transport system substrate-binding protein [Candidatus Kentron sp. H]
MAGINVAPASARGHCVGPLVGHASTDSRSRKRLKVARRKGLTSAEPRHRVIRGRIFRRIVCALWLVMSSPGLLAGEGPRVVASILPVHSLVAGVMRGVGSPALIVRGYGSPHTYRMRPSDAVELQGADLVFWVGVSLETFLHKPFSSLPKSVRVVSLMETDGLTLLGNREGGPWEDHHPDHHRRETDCPGATEPPRPAPNAADASSNHRRQPTDLPNNDHRGHSRCAALRYNPHIWLDPENAGRLVEAIARHLAEIDPIHGARYRTNASALLRRIRGLAERLRKRLSGLGAMPYLVFHDAYPYLEARYGLRAAGSVTASPDRMPSARRVADLRGTMARLNIRCIFREPQFGAKWIEAALEDAGASGQVAIRVLDPLGADMPPGPDLWFRIMENHAQAMVDCLSERF